MIDRKARQSLKIAEISDGDTLASTDKHGTGFYRVVKVNRVTIEVNTEQGERIRAYPHMFDRKVAI